MAALFTKNGNFFALNPFGCMAIAEDFPLSMLLTKPTDTDKEEEATGGEEEELVDHCFIITTPDRKEPEEELLPNPFSTAAVLVVVAALPLTLSIPPLPMEKPCFSFGTDGHYLALIMVSWHVVAWLQFLGRIC